MTKLFIANLPYGATDEMLRHIFEQVGAVRSATIIKDFQTGCSKGFGFVEMESAQEAAEAAAHFNGDLYDGRVVRVELSKGYKQPA